MDDVGGEDGGEIVEQAGKALASTIRAGKITAVAVCRALPSVDITWWPGTPGGIDGGEGWVISPATPPILTNP